jgi:(p)ppGpp synthase/HD superfamily hydrolase
MVNSDDQGIVLDVVIISQERTLLKLFYNSKMNKEKELMRAVQFAALKHVNQRRIDSQKTPYINHPIGVAYSIMNEVRLAIF